VSNSQLIYQFKTYKSSCFMNFTLQNAIAESDKYFNEDPRNTGGWETCEHTSDGINYLVSKHYLKTKDGADVYVTKCNMTVKGTTVQDLLNTYLTQQGTWDFASTSLIQCIENRGSSEVMYAQHKVLSAASVKKDCVFERTHSISGNTAKVYATSIVHPSRPEKYQGYGRSFILFHGCYIIETSPGTIDFTFVHCYDFNGWVHDKFIIAEKAKTAARMNKLVRGTKNAQIVTATNPLILQSNTNKQPTVSYAEYNNMVREAQPTYIPEKSNVHQHPHSQNLKEVNNDSTGFNYCPSCGNPSKGMRFCSGCGQKLF